MCSASRDVSTSPGVAYSSSWTSEPCQACQTGQYQNLMGQAVCNDNCSAGQFIPSSPGPSCEACPVGFSQPEPAVLHGTCSVCSPGLFQGAEGQTACIPCPADTYGTSVESNRNSQETGCLPCPSYRRTTFGLIGATSINKCFSCASGEDSYCIQCTASDMEGKRLCADRGTPMLTVTPQTGVSARTTTCRK